MHLLTLGVNHHTAPVAIREKVAFAPERLEAALLDLTRHGGIAEAVILSTCNRTEIYCGLETLEGERVADWLCDYHGLDPQEIAPYLYRHADHAAVHHAFRVAAGLDSMMLGETQILGQMKEAFAVAHRAGATGKLLNRLFQQTFACAKQVRSSTAIGANAVSVASAAVRLAKQIFARLADQTVLLIGAGEMIELAARHLSEHGVTRLIIANRTVERAQALAARLGGEAIALGDLPQYLARADIVISSTASTLPILGKGAVESALKARRHKPMFMVDIAVPRDIEPEVGDLDDVYLYTIDDLRQVVAENLKSREQAAREAEHLIEGQAAAFMRWVRSLEAVPTIRALREAVAAMERAERERALALIAAGREPREVIEALARRLAAKFTHRPMRALRLADSEGNRALLEAARRLFQLSDE